MASIEVRYFALFREKAGVEREVIDADAGTYRELYEQIAERYGFGLPAEMIQVAVNDEFGSLHSPLVPNARVVFIPPVAGG